MASPDEHPRDPLQRILSWSFRAGRLFGVPVYVHWSVLLLATLIVGWNYNQTHDPWSILWGSFKAVGFAAIILAHEFGHVLAGMKNGVRSTHVTLTPLGGLAHLEDRMRNPVMEIEVTIAGPLVNMLLMVLSLMPILLASEIGTLSIGYLLYATGLFSVLAWLFAVNAAMAVFNLLPIFPWDGGRLFRAIRSFKRPAWKATVTACHLSYVLCPGLMVLGILRLMRDDALFGSLLLWMGISTILTCHRQLQFLHYSKEIYDPSAGRSGRYSAAYEDVTWRGEEGAEPDAAPGFFARMRARRAAKRREHVALAAAENRRREAEQQQRLDAILDKINSSGLNSLSEDEKKFLAQASEKMRKR
jgi:Zn-dependent protease